MKELIKIEFPIDLACENSVATLDYEDCGILQGMYLIVTIINRYYF